MKHIEAAWKSQSQGLFSAINLDLRFKPLLRAMFFGGALAAVSVLAKARKPEETVDDLMTELRNYEDELDARDASKRHIQ